MMIQDEDPQFLTPALCRGARGMLDWTQAELAERALVSRSTIRDYEGGRHHLHRASAAQIRRAMEQAGIRFHCGEDKGSGLYLLGPGAAES